MRLEITNLTKRFGDNVVLDSVNLTLDGINSLVLIGPSGGGKTTLLRILAGLEHMNGGNIIINSHCLNCPEQELLEYRLCRKYLLFRRFNRKIRKSNRQR